MSKFNIRQIDRNNKKDYEMWKKKLNLFDGSTIFHNPDFLSYHGDKFNEHHLGIFKGEELFGLLPLAFIDENNNKIAKSPYGASYGSILFIKSLSYGESTHIIQDIIEYLKNQQINEIILTPPPAIYYGNHSDTFTFTMLEIGFKCINSDITSIVKLQAENKNQFNSRAKRSLKKADLNNLDIVHDANFEDFWLLMSKTFTKHSVKPTHNKDEFKLLTNNLLNKIKIDIAYLDDKPISGIANFIINADVKMSFYICQDDEYKELNAQTVLINSILNKAHQEGYKFYDFGTSSIEMKARPNIFEFKEGLGAKGIFRHTYKLRLNNNV